MGKESAMNVFSRFIDIVNANINAALDKAEDPEKMLRLMIQEMEDAVIELKSSCASDMASKLSYEHKANELEKEENRWEARARLAVSHSKDDLAREAIAARHEAAKERESCAACIGRLTDAITREKEEIRQLEEKIADSKQRLRTMTERSERIKARMKEKDEERLRRERRFEEMERKIDRAEDFHAAGSSFDDEEIERELEALKREENGQD